MPPRASITPMPSNISIPVDYGTTIPSRGRSTSPIRPVPSTEKLRRAPSRTFIPLAFPIDIIDFPESPHPRIKLAIRESAPVFMGGATAEGAIQMIIDGGSKPSRAKTKLSPLSIDRLCVSLVGIERSGARQHMFGCLMTDLIDEAHPPPVEMARPNQPMSDRLWEVMPSSTILPFRLDLPVRLGPPPYRSKKNTITYLISVLVEAKEAGVRAYVRVSEEVTVLTVHDPEKALLNLPNPLVVTDEIQSSHRQSLDTVVLTAGIHRQTWISGYPLFVDIRISNRGSRVAKKVELQLERSTFVYAHTAPTDEVGLRATLRMPDKCEKEVLVRTLSPGWQVPSRSHDLKTCRLQIPPGLVSVDEGRFFGNSIDIPPNSLAQVAATIEHKHRSRSPSTPYTSYRYRPGQAFIAARRQSFDEVARRTISRDDVDAIAESLAQSRNVPSLQPRRHASTSVISATTDPNTNPSPKPNPAYRSSRFVEGTNSFRNPPSRAPPRPPLFNTFVIEKGSSSQRPAIAERKTHRASMEERSVLPPHRASMDECTIHPLPHQHQHHTVQHRRTRSSLTERGHRGPRLQRSTSGLGFESSGDEEEVVDGDPFVETSTRARLKRRVKTESQRALRSDF
ncbi:MAG: hypothetical protein Q9218_003480 [Villophora microphyllina]